MVQGKYHQAPRGSPGTRGALEATRPHCHSKQALHQPPACRPGSPQGFTGRFGWAQCPAHLCVAFHNCAIFLLLPPQRLSAALELVNYFSLRVWYLTHFCGQEEAGEVTQQGLALFQPGKSRPVLSAGRKLGHKHILLATNSASCALEASAPHPDWCHLLWPLLWWAKNRHKPTSTASYWCM